MSKKVKAQKVTPSQEAEHTVYAIMRLAEALFTLKAMGRLCEKCAADKAIEEAMLNNAIVLYGSVFKFSDVGGGTRHKIDEKSCVPKEYEDLHNRLTDYRDKLVAHFDFDFRKPTQKKAKGGSPYYIMDKSPVQDMKDEIPQIEKLVRAVLAVLTSRDILRPTTST